MTIDEYLDGHSKLNFYEAMEASGWQVVMSPSATPSTIPARARQSALTRLVRARKARKSRREGVKPR